VKRKIPATAVNTLDKEWVRSTTFTANGRKIESGTELSITGQPGRWRFVEHVVNGDAEWVTVIGGKKGERTTRSFLPARIKQVHYKKKLRTT
jgi:hypothetical protein